MQEEKSVSKSLIGAIIALFIAIIAGGGLAWMGTKNNSSLPKPTESAVVPSKDPVPPADISANTEDGTVKIFQVDETTGEKFKVVPEVRKIASSNPETPNSLVNKSLKVLLSSSGKPAQTGTFGKEVSTIPPTTKLISTKIKSNGIHIDLSKEFMEGGGSTSMQGRLAQILYTATERNTTARVWITIEGKKLETLGGEGIEVKQPLTRKSFQEDFNQSIGEQ
jgi:spore germination protein GerM